MRKILLIIALLVVFPIYAAITVSTILFAILVFVVSGNSFLEEGEIGQTWKHFKECFLSKKEVSHGV